VRRRLFHAAIAIILVICILCPFVEMTLGWDNSIFMTGHDTESTLAVVVFLIELVVALSSGLVFLLSCIQVKWRIDEGRESPASDSCFRIPFPDSSPPVPLRI
jgi:hypothetical protein